MSAGEKRWLAHGSQGRREAAAGFDDRAIYRELCKPHSERSLPIVQALREEALPAFQAWMTKEDRLDY